MTSPSQASISGLYNTGVDNNNVVISDSPSSGTADLHYRLFSSPITNGPTAAYVVQTTGFPIPPWYPNSAQGTVGGSKWISGPGSPPTNPTANGIYDYRTTFQSNSTAAVTFAGFLTADDSAALFLNGVQVASTGGDQIYATFFSFSFTSALLVGTNILDIRVNNTHNVVEGARLQISAVPEPATIMMGLGAAGMFGFAKFARRHRARA